MKKKIREIVLSYGADLCGFAGSDRFNNAPSGFKPTDIFSDCKSVISFAIALPRGLGKVNPRLIYGHFNYKSCADVDIIAFQSVKKIENDFNCIAVPMPCDIPYEYWNSEKLEGKGLLSMKHTAVQAGLGSLGKSTLFINEQYGNMLTLGAILLNIDLPSDEFAENICINNCHNCINSCPVNAINNGLVDQELCRKNTYGKTERGFDTVDCNKCRVVCPLNYTNSRV